MNLDGFSAHAGQDALVEYASSTKGTVKEIFLVHGEPDAAQALQAKLAQAVMTSVMYPARNQVRFRLNPIHAIIGLAHDGGMERCQSG